MTKHIPLPLSDEAKNQALSYVLGWLDTGQQAAYRTRLENAPAELEYVRDLYETMGLVGSLAPEAEPPQGLKAKLLQKLDNNKGSAETFGGHLKEAMVKLTERVIPQWCLEMPWQETALPGIRRRILFEDKSASIRGMLLNIAAGGQYPAHRHVGDEYFFLIEGDLVVEEYAGQERFEMFPGDFQRSLPGSIHGRLHSPSGCFALVINSTKDEVLEDLETVRK